LAVGGFILIVVLYAFSQMREVTKQGNFFGPFGGNDETPIALEEAAPEAVLHREGFRALAAKARQVVPPGKNPKSQQEYPPARGKALVWDVTADDLSEAHGKLPAEVRAPNPDGDVLVFLITSQDRHACLNYNSGFFGGGPPCGVHGFRTDTILTVVGMPGQRLLGQYRIGGDAPPWMTYIQSGQTEVDGAWTGPVATWVEASVRGPKWRERRKAGLPLEHEQFADLVEQASKVIPQCEAKGSSGPFPKLPARALIWHWMPKALLNHMNLAQSHLPDDQRAEPGDTEFLAVLVIGHKYIRDHFGAPPSQDVDRSDYTVALVVMPACQPVGVFTVRGEEWPAERRRVKGDGPDEKETMARWVTKFLRSPHLAVGNIPPANGRGPVIRNK
jgi:hypothetical protein